MLSKVKDQKATEFDLSRNNLSHASSNVLNKTFFLYYELLIQG